jgi:hypothetical protein
MAGNGHLKNIHNEIESQAFTDTPGKYDFRAKSNVSKKGWNLPEISPFQALPWP